MCEMGKIQKNSLSLGGPERERVKGRGKGRLCYKIYPSPVASVTLQRRGAVLNNGGNYQQLLFLFIFPPLHVLGSEARTQDAHKPCPCLRFVEKSPQSEQDH